MSSFKYLSLITKLRLLFFFPRHTDCYRGLGIYRLNDYRGNDCIFISVTTETTRSVTTLTTTVKFASTVSTACGCLSLPTPTTRVLSVATQIVSVTAMSGVILLDMLNLRLIHGSLDGSSIFKDGIYRHHHN